MIGWGQACVTMMERELHEWVGHGQYQVPGWSCSGPQSQLGERWSETQRYGLEFFVFY